MVNQKEQKYRIDGNVVYLDVSTPKYPNIEAMIDLEDLNKIFEYSKFYTNSYGYVRTTYKKKKLKLHRIIMNVTDSKIFVDHINHNKLDNRKCNLRLCNRSQNQMNRKINKNNTSKYKGVYWNKNANKWIARISINKKNIHLGCFNNEIDAAKAYNQYAIENVGEFALLNEVNR